MCDDDNDDDDDDDDDNNANGGGGLSVGAIIGIVVGVLFVGKFVFM